MDANYNKNVFINCPYDNEYIHMKQAIVFAVSICGFTPKLVSMNHDGTIPRIDKIRAMINDSKYGIHDLSRYKAIKEGEFYRLNMPFELGMDLGCRCFSNKHSEKNILVLSEMPYTHQPSFSDFSGYDPKCHKNDIYQAMYLIREFFYNEVPHEENDTYIKKKEMRPLYERFQTKLYSDSGGKTEDLNQMSDFEYYTEICNFFNHFNFKEQ